MRKARRLRPAPRKACAFTIGEQVVWTYRNSIKLRRCCGNMCLVTAEVIQPGQYRVRIHLVQASGVQRPRWVKPANLRPAMPGEPIYAYPDSI